MVKIGEYLDVHLEGIRKLINIFIVILFGILIFVVFIQVIARYIFNSPFSWSEEIARYIQVWLIFLTSSICIRKGRHILLDYATHYFSSKIKKINEIIGNLIIMIYLFVMTIYGWKTVIAIFGRQTSPAMQIPLYLIYLALPLSGLLMILENLVILLKLLGQNRK